MTGRLALGSTVTRTQDPTLALLFGDSLTVMTLQVDHHDCGLSDWLLHVYRVRRGRQLCVTA